MKSTQISTKKRKSGMCSSKKRKTAIAVLLLVVLCCLFSTITQATQAEYDNNSVNRARITYFTAFENYETGIVERQDTTYTVTDNVLFVERTVYQTVGYEIYFAIDDNDNIENFLFETDTYIQLQDGTKRPPIITSKDETYKSSTGAQRNPWYAQTGGMIKGTNGISGASYLTDYIDIEFNNRGDSLHIKVKTNDRLARGNVYDRIKIVLPVTSIIGLYLENTRLVINDKVYEITTNIDNIINEIEDKEQEAHNAVTNDEYEYDDPTLAIRATHTSVNNALQYISEHIYSLDNIVLYQSIFQVSPTLNLVFVLSLTFALLSYVLFGKVI